MKFFKPTKPAWMSRNECKAIKAVESLTDRETLIKVARESENEKVREAAVIKLNGGKELSDGDICPFCNKTEAIESKTWEEKSERLILSNNVGNDYYVPETKVYYEQNCKYCRHIYKKEYESMLDGDSTDFREAPFNR